jgi:hypothetical protein
MTLGPGVIEALSFFLVSDVAGGFQGWLPYAGFQTGHLALGFLSRRVSQRFSYRVLALLILKECVCDNFWNGGTLHVAADSVVDIVFVSIGVCLAERRRAFHAA